MHNTTLVELFADIKDQQPSPCKYGNIVVDHACYCHSLGTQSSKCPIWTDGSKWSRTNCKWFIRRRK